MCTLHSETLKLTQTEQKMTYSEPDELRHLTRPITLNVTGRLSLLRQLQHQQKSKQKKATTDMWKTCLERIQ